jgi:hypothetical protein
MTIDTQNRTREMGSKALKPNGRDTQPSFAAIDNMPLPANRIAAIEHGLTQYQHTLDECDRLAEELRRAEDRNRLALAEVEMRDRTIAELHRRVAELEADRDRKVADFAVMETLFVSIRAQLDAFLRLPSAGEESPSDSRTR